MRYVDTFGSQGSHYGGRDIKYAIRGFKQESYKDEMNLETAAWTHNSKICMYVCVCIHVCVKVDMNLCAYKFTYVHTYIYKSMHVSFICQFKEPRSKDTSGIMNIPII